jgi:hypothetical protein
MARVHSQYSEKKHTRKAKRKARKLRQQRHYRTMGAVNVGRAARDPQPAPRARGYLAAQFWKRFKLSEALEAVGVFKEGLPLGHILLVVMLFGLLNAASLAQVVQEVNQDVVLRAMLGLEELEVKQVYRGLSYLTVADYQAWMALLVQELQKEPWTASRREGVLIGDGTQRRRSYSRKRGRGMRWLRVILLHGEKRFDYGYEVESTHYADTEKDYPLLSAIYEPSAERAAELEEARQRQKMGLDLRRTADRVTWLKYLIEQREDVEWIELGGRDLNPWLRKEVEALEVPWVGISGKRQVYQLSRRAKPQSAEALLQTKASQRWLALPDLGYALLWLGEAQSAIGAVVLLLAEHVASGERRLHVLPPQTEEAAMAQVTRVLAREQESEDAGRLDLMVNLVEQSLQAGIQAETGVFDRGYFSVLFLSRLLKAGLRRVILPAKKGVHYGLADAVYDLPELWPLLSDDEFQRVSHEHRTYQVASRQATLGDLGLVQLVFVRHLSRHQNVLRSFVLVCTDVQFAPAAVLQAYLLRWRIEVGYREVKQNHAFGRTLSTELVEVYGQLVLSFLAYTCLSVTRLLTARLRDKTLGWIKRQYFNAVVEFHIAADGTPTLLFPPWLWDNFGLPEYCALC